MNKAIRAVIKYGFILGLLTLLGSGCILVDWDRDEGGHGRGGGEYHHDR